MSAPLYRSPWYLFNGHLQTIAPFLTDRPDKGLYKTERLELNDGDFLDLDWIRGGNDCLMILSHGLEGNSRSYYVKAAAKYFSMKNWDVLAWNFRGCSTELNRLPLFYHAGETKDLASVIDHAVTNFNYEKIVLVGYSIGGSITLNYLVNSATDNKITAACTFSVPLDKENSLEKMRRPLNKMYERKFLDKLKRKLEKLSLKHPEIFCPEDFNSLRSLADFSEKYTAPIYGFKSADDLHKDGSCLDKLDHIEIPTLIVNAKNDPLLGERSYPSRVSNELVTFESPKSGGHAGFTMADNPYGWMPLRIEAFLNSIQSLP